MKLDSLKVEGKLQAETAKTPINIETEKGIEVPAGGSVGGSNPAAGGSKKKIPVTLKSKKSTINIGGRVEGNEGPVNLQAKGEVKISGIVNSWGEGVSVTSDTGSVKIEGGGIVAADKTVNIKSGDGKPTLIDCHVHSRGEDVVINGKKNKKAGNVHIGKDDTVSAYREVIISADTLFISGTILANTVQKFAKVAILDSTGHIGRPDGKPINLTNKIDTVHATQEKTDGRAGEEGSHCKITGGENCVIDFSASPYAIDASVSVKVASGPGGTIDLRGNPPGWPVIQCPGTIELYADYILLDVGVLLEDICGPGPVIAGPYMPTKVVTTGCIKSGTGYPTRDVEVEFVVRNLGNVTDTYDIFVSDSEGWPFIVSDGQITLGDDPFDSTVTITLSVPPTATPDVDTNIVAVSVVSTTDPAVTYAETTFVAVHDLSLLREFSLNPWEIQSGHPGDTAYVYHWIMNVNELEDSFSVAATDSLGWELLPPWGSFPLLAGEDTVYCTGMVIPGTSFDGEVNKLYLRVTSEIDTANTKRDTVTVEVGAVTGVDTDNLPAPRTIRHSSYPNPFNPRVTIRFTVPPSGEETSIVIYDLSGRHVRTIFRGHLKAGEYVKDWDGRNKKGDTVSSGIYFYQIKAGRHSATGKLVLIR